MIKFKIQKFFSGANFPPYLIAIAVILILSIFPRIWNLQKYPPVVVDESANLRDINLILNNGFNITDFHWDFSKSRVVHIPVILLMKIGVEDQLLALRLSSVIISIFSLIPFFLITKELTNKIIAFFVTLLFSYNYYFLQFSRVGWTDIVLNIFLGLILFWTILQIKKRKGINIILIALSGALAGLIFYSYRSGIILIVAAFLYLIPKKINSKNNLLLLITTSLIFLIFFLLTSMPWINKISSNLDKYNLRLRVVSIKNIQLPYHKINSKKGVIYYQIKQSMSSWLLFNNQVGSGEENQRYLPQGFPIVNIFIKITFWIGIIYGLFRLKKYYPLYIITFMGIYGQIATVDPPNGARGLIILPCIYLISSLGFLKIHELLGKKDCVLYIFAVLAFLFSVGDFMFYQYWMVWIKV